MKWLKIKYSMEKDEERLYLRLNKILTALLDDFMTILIQTIIPQNSRQVE
jgi:hypothetical protein